MWLLSLACRGPAPDSPDPTPDDSSEVVIEVGPPNVLLVLLDDVGVDKFSGYAGDVEGYEPSYLPQTDTFDQVGAAGVRFTHAWSNPLCSPTRASLFTGRHPYRHGVGSVVPQGPELADEEVTFAEAALGYKVGLFGKWHVGDSGLPTDETPSPRWYEVAEGNTRDNPVELQHSLNPIRQGFDAYIGGLSGTLCTVTPEGCIGDYDFWLVAAGNAEEPGRTQAWWEEGYATEVQVDDALAWISQQDEVPWIAMVALHAPHTPLHGTGGRGCSQIRPNTLRVPPIQTYAGMLECADHHVGRLLEALDAQGDLDDTLIVIAGDNGTEAHFREGPFAADQTVKGTAYESSVHVPLVISTGESWSSVAAGGEPVESELVALPGREVDQMVHTTDLFATVLEWVGGDRSTGVDSVSLVPVLEGPSREIPRDVLYTERFWDEGGFTVGFAALKTVEHTKLVVSVLSNGEAACRRLELYESAAVEGDDRYGDADMEAAQTELDAALQALIDDGAAWLDQPPCP